MFDVVIFFGVFFWIEPSNASFQSWRCFLTRYGPLKILDCFWSMIFLVGCDFLRHPKIDFWKNFVKNCQKIDKLPVFEEPWLCGRNTALGRCALKNDPQFWLSPLYDFWQRGKSGTHRFWSWLSANIDFTTFGSWLEDTSVLARRHMCCEIPLGL